MLIVDNDRVYVDSELSKIWLSVPMARSVMMNQSHEITTLFKANETEVLLFDLREFIS
jgi:hypothetical protein